MNTLRHRNTRKLAALEAELRELRAENERLLTMAYRDALTGLRNRRCFGERLSEELSRCVRASSRSLSVITIDVNDFKALNDRLGHLAGDAALMAVARFLESMLREADVCCRVGGDEFAVLLPDTTAAECAAVIERLRAKLPALAAVGLGARGLSIGSATRCAGDDAIELLSRADVSMYADKRGGRLRKREAVEGAFATAA